MPAPVRIEPLRSFAPAAVLGAIALVHAVRGAYVDSLFWAGVLGCLVVERAVLHRVPDRRPTGLRLPPRPVVGATLLVLVAVGGFLASQWRIGDPGARLAIGAVGVLVLVAVFAIRAPAHRPVSRLVSRSGRGWPWLLLAVLAALIQLGFALAALAAGTGAPTFSGVVDLALGEPVVRSALLAAWLLAGYLLLCRTGILRRRE